MFHVKPQKSGAFPGTPTSRGKRRGVGFDLIRTWKAAPCRTRPRASNPSVANASEFQRLGTWSSGGSETTRNPPIFKNRAAHSAVTAGGPKDRAVTRSATPVNLGSRATSSARPRINCAPVGASDHVSTSSKSLIRFFIESTRIALVAQCSRSTRPGRPPPLPRSRNTFGGADAWSSQQREKPSACMICGSIGPGPMKPRLLDSSRARLSQELAIPDDYAGTTTTKRRGSSPSERVVTLGLSVRASCTALRSAADIGSKARSSPVSATS